MSLIKKYLLVALIVLLVLQSHCQAPVLNVDFSLFFPEDKTGLQLCGLYVKDPLKLNLKYSRPMVPLKHMGYKLEIVNGLAHITLKQEYYNPNSVFLDVYYSFPINPDSSIYRMTAQFGNKLVEGVVKEKEQARKQFEQAKQEGKQAALTNIDQNSKDIINMEIGNVPPQTRVTITIAFVQEMTLSVSTFYRLQILSTISPRYSNWAPITSASRVDQFSLSDFSKSLQARDAKSSFTWSFDIVLKAYRKVTFYNSTTHKLREIKNSQDGKEVVLTLPNDQVPNKDFVFLYTTEDFQLPSYVIGKNDKTSTIMVSFIPKFSELSNDQAYKALNEGKSTEFDLNTVKGEYVFILDRSGSMDTSSRISKAKEALVIFLKSLPENSYFNVISFGSSFSKMFPKSERYNNIKIKQAIDQVQRMGADMGGTQIFFPLQSALDEPTISGYPRFVFLLTDGQVQNTEGVIQMAKNKAKGARINSIGVGNGASVRLVQGAAEAGKGKYVMITDDEDPSKKIINLLESALSPLITSLRLVYDKAKVRTVIPNPDKLPYILKDDVANFYIIYNGELKEKTNIKLEYEDSVSKKVYKLEVEVDPKSESFAFVDKMAHFKVLRALENLSKNSQLAIGDYLVYSKTNANNDLKKEAQLYSVEHQILSQYTSFIAVVKQVSSNLKNLLKEVGYLPIIIAQPVAVQYTESTILQPTVAFSTSFSPSFTQSFTQSVSSGSGSGFSASAAPSINFARASFGPSGGSMGQSTMAFSSAQPKIFSPYVGNNAFAMPSSLPAPAPRPPPPAKVFGGLLNAAPDSQTFLFDDVAESVQAVQQQQAPQADATQTITQPSALPSSISNTPTARSQSTSTSINTGIRQADLVTLQNTDGSWSSQGLLNQLLQQCNCLGKTELEQLKKEIRLDIILTRLVLSYIVSKNLGPQYALIARKAQSWLKRAVIEQKVDQAKLAKFVFASSP